MRKQDSSRTTSRRPSNGDRGEILEPPQRFDYVLHEANKSAAKLGSKRGMQQLMGAQAAMEGRPINRP